eukprot:TRINITY_DN8930_c0_g1_i1.p1 TRINITY_DN8930_c0_g1~~TRINITY_DN8930_c0_g1_i1.p1  ORF type:complete len:142 (-),score=53.46 TRINITY_DN8930_c0_g1_i1:244-669(-)
MNNLDPHHNSCNIPEEDYKEDDTVAVQTHVDDLQERKNKKKAKRDEAADEGEKQSKSAEKEKRKNVTSEDEKDELEILGSDLDLDSLLDSNNTKPSKKKAAAKKPKQNGKSSSLSKKTLNDLETEMESVVKRKRLKRILDK